jgi:DNA-binding winged helix-turn-helix (wHTH) protein/TolB-like protein/Tfp pilus assembly protein PilF
MSEENNELYEFGFFRLDVTEHTLTRLDGSKNGQLPEKAFQTLCLLVQKSGRLLTKKDLIDQIWPSAFVEENNLDKCIHAIRHVLGEKPNEQKYIQTVRKHGYRFVAEVRKCPANGNGTAAGQPPRQDSAEAEPITHGTDPKVLPKPHHAAVSRKSSVRVALAGLVVAIAAAGLYVGTMRRSSLPESVSIAVLPLNPVSVSDIYAFLEGGITDSLFLRLNSAKGFTIRPLSAMRKYFGVEQDPVAVGREQMADYVVASNYQLSGGRIQVTTQLVDVKTGQVAESFKVEEDAENSFAIQDSIAREISDSIVARFGMATGSIISRRGTTNENAYRYYLQAVNLMGRMSLPVAQEAVEYLEEAVQLDPNFARAHAGLARSRVELSNLVDDPAEDCNKAQTAVGEALKLDAELAQAYEASAMLKHRCAWDFAGAESDFRKALELDPNSDSTHAAYAWYLNMAGRSDEANAQIEWAIRLNPNSTAYHIQHGIILYFSRRFDASIDELRHASEIGQLGLAYGWLWTASIEKGDEAQAFQWFLKYETEKQLKPNAAKIENLKAIFRNDGWNGIRKMQLETELASPIYEKGRFYRISRLETQLGNNDDAFKYLNLAFERRDAQLLLLKYEPTFDALRSDPRYQDLLQRIGFPPNT